MDKYYTPEIEEFHVGFEYEHLQDEEMFGEITRGINYCLYTLDAQDELEVIVANLEDDKLRVKHLDKEDIESLGFGRDMLRVSMVDTYIYNIKGVKFDYILYFTPNKNELFNVRIEDYYINDESRRRTSNVFLGDIKNKSELKRILKQLNIIE